jgi:hypothetical protein
VDVVVLVERVGASFERGIERWRDLEPPPGVLAVVIGKVGEAAARKARVPLVASTAQPAEIARAVDRALALRWSGKLAANYARGALGLRAVADPIEDAARVLKAARQADLEIVREALRWYAMHYAATTPLIALLREARALTIPEVELVRSIDGARTMQTVINKAAIGMQGAGRLLWALACVGALKLTPEPVDLTVPERRVVAMARLHLRTRAARSERATHYDLLEIQPASSGVAEIEQAVQMLAIRFAPERMNGLDLGDAAGLVAPIWKAIQRARAILSDPVDRLRYNEVLSAKRASIQSTWTFGPNDRQRAEESFARGQRALVAGEPFKAVSEMAAAARAHADHPDYEASLAWARYRADAARGKPKDQIALAERRAAENALAGRRPWPRALVALALLCAADEDPDAARWHLKEALACDPNLPVAKQLLSRLGAARPG